MSASTPDPRPTDRPESPGAPATVAARAADQQADARPALHVEAPLDADAAPIRHEGDARFSDTIGLGATIDVTGDLIAEALIRGATLTVGGHLHARAGIQGKGGGPIRVGGAMTATYLDSVGADVFGSLRVERQISACTLVVHTHLVAPDAALVGGQATVRGRVELGIAGSESCVPTLLVLGTVPSIEPRLIELSALAERLAADKADAERQDRQLSLPGAVLSPADKERHTELSFKLHELQGRVARCLTAREAGLSAVARLRRFDLRVTHVIHPGFTVACPAQSFVFRREVPGPARIFADPHGEMLIQSEGQEATVPLQTVAELKARAA